MKALLMFSIIIVLFEDTWVISSAISVRKNGPIYEKGGNEDNALVEDDYKRDLTDSEEAIDIGISQVKDWPRKDIQFGQVSGVSSDTRGNIYVFHRADRTWNINTFFLNNNTYSDIASGPISKSTVAVIHPKTGDILHEWGSNMFYLPHGITVDKDNNVWVTDVALHQVFKFPPIYPATTKNKTPLLTLGTRFVYGTDLSLFCKPTAVAVTSNGDFFVSDGYCNSRIIKYSADGKILLSWGRSTLTKGPVPAPAFHFSVPHDLTLMEDRNAICVADRENGRLQYFYSTNGTFIDEIESPKIGSRVFGASYTPAAGGLFFIINTASLYLGEISHGTVVDVFSKKVIKMFQPNVTIFRAPHDILVTANATELYVTELSPPRVWKFKLTGLSLDSSAISKPNVDTSSYLPQDNTHISDSKSSGTMVMAMIITAAVLCFGAALLIAALIYSRARTRGRSLSLEDLMLEPRNIYA